MYSYAGHPGSYRHMEDLLHLDACRPKGNPPPPPELAKVISPLRWQKWDARLSSYPDQRLRTYLVEGIRHGFRIGYSYDAVCRRAKGNMKSAQDNPQVIRDYLATELQAGRILGPLDGEQYPYIQTSRFGVIPKSTPGKWRLIVDLSSPEGGSVNDGIQESRCSMTYVTVADAAQGITAYGKGALMMKVDIRSAYRVIPIHPDDRWLLGMMWEGSVFVDTALPFGLRSAPKIFSAIADAAEWIVRQQGVEFVIHYLDDFLVVTAANEYSGNHSLRLLLETFEQLGLPVAWDKLEGPATCLTFLGFELDSVREEIRLPQRKLEEIKKEVQEWIGRKSCRRKELESLIGRLCHASRVVHPGKTFMRRLFEALAGARRSHHHIRLSSAIRSDILWWHSFVDGWNGVSLIPKPLFQRSVLWSDASGSLGCGAICPSLGRWIQLLWDGREKALAVGQADSITWMELLPIVLASAVWGPEWHGQSVLVYCDNTGAVAVANSGYSKAPRIMHLLRCLFFIRAYYQFSMHVVYIEGANNSWADAISRDNPSIIESQVFRSSYHRTPIPEELISLLVVEQPDWTSGRWIELFKSCLQPVLPHLP